MISGNAVQGKLESHRSAVRQLLDHLVVIADEDIRANYQQALAKMDAVLESGVARERKVQSDGNLSPAGKMAEMLQIWRDTLKALAFVGEKAATIKDSAASLRAELFSLPDAPKGQDPVITLLYEQEVRGYLRGLPEPQRMKEYIRAVSENDTQTIRAFRLAPGQPLIPNEIRERTDRDSIAIKEPKRWARLESLNLLARQFGSLDASFTRSLDPGYEPKFPTPQPPTLQSVIRAKPLGPRAENF
jgi:hypothetical protein